ncbi:hypothetical protein J6590_004381 [Homalodisca vitripennis]|nr:hypothetical protein J6590_004381 [Homalodisca vitripennis]
MNIKTHPVCVRVTICVATAHHRAGCAVMLPTRETKGMHEFCLITDAKKDYPGRGCETMGSGKQKHRAKE